MFFGNKWIIFKFQKWKDNPHFADEAKARGQEKDDFKISLSL